jgi:hypothetical protein
VGYGASNGTILGVRIGSGDSVPLRGGVLLGNVGAEEATHRLGIPVCAAEEADDDDQDRTGEECTGQRLKAKSD